MVATCGVNLEHMSVMARNENVGIIGGVGGPKMTRTVFKLGIVGPYTRLCQWTLGTVLYGRRLCNCTCWWESHFIVV